MAQSRFSELYNRGQVNEYVEDEYLLVQVDDHNTTAEVCMPFEGTIWSITGKPIGSYRPLSQCLNGGPPFHPRCSHYLDPIEVDTVYQRKGTEVVRTSGALYDIKAYKPNEAVEAAEERIRTRIGTTPSLRTQVGWMPPDQLLKRVSAVTPDDAGAPGTAADTAPDSGEHAGNVSAGQQLTPENVEKLIGGASGGMSAIDTEYSKRMQSFREAVPIAPLETDKRAVYDVLTGAATRVTISNQNTAVDSKRVIIERGYSKMGIKHIVLRHYKTDLGWLNSEELLNIADVIKKSSHSISHGSNKYVFVDQSGTRFTVITKPGKKERLVTYYSNRGTIKTPTEKP